MNDKAIEFESTRYKVAKAIKQMETSGLKIQKFKELYEKIITECNNSNQTIPASIIDSSTNFATDCLIDNYSNAIQKLELLYLELQKYEIYTKISSYAKYLELFLNKKNKTKEDFDNYRTTLIDVLNKLISSNTLDYDIEGNIIEEIYRIAYLFIKEEIKFLGHSKTLEILNKNEIHMNYLDKQITQELETINFNDPKFEGILKAKKHIETKGFTSTYANEEFIKALIVRELTHDELIKIIDLLIKRITNNLKIIDEHKTTPNNNNNNEKINYLRKHIIKNITLFITSGSILIALILGSIKLAKYKKYNNTTTTYSISNGLITTTDYDKNTEEYVKIYDYSPYKESNNVYSERTVHTYTILPIEGMNIEDYLNLNLNYLNNVKKRTTTEYKNYLTQDDLYEETFRVIKMVNVNTSDYQDSFAIGGLFALLLVSLILELIAEIIYDKTKLNDDPIYISLVSAIKGLASDIKELQKIKRNNQELQQKLTEIEKQCQKLIFENKEYINELMNYYKIIKNDEDSVEETQKIDKVLKLVKKEN